MKHSVEFEHVRRNSASAEKQKNLADEYQLITQSLGKKYHKYCHTKSNSGSDDSFALGYQHWNQWLKKHKMLVSVRLTKREFNDFWTWFSARKVEYSTHSSNDGIRIDKVIDDFVASKVFRSRASANAFIKSIDIDHSGCISFEEFMSALSTQGDVEHISLLKRFISQLKVESDNPSKKKNRLRLGAANMAENATSGAIPHLTTGRREEKSIGRVPSFEKSCYHVVLPPISK